MFIGHYAVGLAAKKKEPAVSLAILFIAVQLLDLIWPILVLLDIETLSVDPGNTKVTPLNFSYYPYSHSLLMAIIWSLLFALVYYLSTKNRQGSILISALVFSHWVLDYITHRPDLPLSPFGETKVGLGLWNYPVAESIIEIGMFAAGALIYYQVAKPARVKTYWSLIVFFLIIHVLNLMSPPPPDPKIVAWSANAMWIFIAWAWWVERPGQKQAG